MSSGTKTIPYSALQRARQDLDEAHKAQDAAERALLTARREADRLVQRIDRCLRVPAAEYVPAIQEVFTLIDTWRKS